MRSLAAAFMLVFAHVCSAEGLLEIDPQVDPPENREWGKLEEGEEAQLNGMNFGPALILQRRMVDMRVKAALIACGQKGLAKAVGPSSSDLVDEALGVLSDMEPKVPTDMRTAMSIAASLSYYQGGLIDSAILAHELAPQEQRDARCKDWEHTAHQILNQREED